MCGLDTSLICDLILHVLIDLPGVHFVALCSVLLALETALQSKFSFYFIFLC